MRGWEGPGRRKGGREGPEKSKWKCRLHILTHHIIIPLAYKSAAKEREERNHKTIQLMPTYKPFLLTPTI